MGSSNTVTWDRWKAAKNVGSVGTGGHGDDVANRMLGGKQGHVIHATVPLMKIQASSTMLCFVRAASCISHGGGDLPSVASVLFVTRRKEEVAVDRGAGVVRVRACGSER